MTSGFCKSRSIQKNAPFGQIDPLYHSDVNILFVGASETLKRDGNIYIILRTSQIYTAVDSS
jgi:hypothetical protein